MSVAREMMALGFVASITHEDSDVDAAKFKAPDDSLVITVVNEYMIVQHRGERASLYQYKNNDHAEKNVLILGKAWKATAEKC